MRQDLPVFTVAYPDASYGVTLSDDAGTSWKLRGTVRQWWEQGGNTHRSNLVAGEYAIRLNLKFLNLKKDHRIDGLEMLLGGYPSHGFVVDRKEASKLFKRVTSPTGDMHELFSKLGLDMVLPRSASRNQPPRLEYLNAENTQPDKPASPEAAVKPSGAGGKSSARRAGSANIRGRVSPRARAVDDVDTPSRQNGPDGSSN